MNDDITIKRIVIKSPGYPQVHYERTRNTMPETCQFPASGAEEVEAASDFCQAALLIAERLVDICGLDSGAFWGSDRTRLTQIDFKYTEDAIGIKAVLASFDEANALAHKYPSPYLTEKIVSEDHLLAKAVDAILDAAIEFVKGRAAKEQLGLEFVQMVRSGEVELLAGN